MTNALKYNNTRFSITLMLLYSFVVLTEFFILVVQFDGINIDTIGVRVIQFNLQFSFLIFFPLIVYYQNKNISFLLILCFQIINSVLLWGFYFFIANEPLGYDANDALAYQNALETTFGKEYIELIKVLKSVPRTASASDWGYPTYRFLIYKLVPHLEGGLLATVIINAIIHAISSIYVYNLSKRFVSYSASIFVMALWGLSATSIHVNTCGLKETIFSFFTVLAVYNLVEIEYGNKLKRTFLFFLNTTFIWFFRNYISIFLVITYLGCYPFRKVFYKFYVLFFISVFLVGFFGMELLVNVLPELSFVKIGRDKRLTEFFGSTGLVPNLMNFFFAWIAPIPRVNSSAEIKQLIFSGFGIYKAFFSLFSIYSIFLILKHRYRLFYPILTFMVCNVILVIITCNSLDFRFLHISTFIDFILIVFGFSDIERKGFNLSKKKKYDLSIITLLIFVFVYLMVLIYNR